VINLQSKLRAFVVVTALLVPVFGHADGIDVESGFLKWWQTWNAGEAGKKGLLDALVYQNSEKQEIGISIGELWGETGVEKYNYFKVLTAMQDPRRISNVRTLNNGKVFALTVHGGSRLTFYQNLEPVLLMRMLFLKWKGRNHSANRKKLLLQSTFLVTFLLRLQKLSTNGVPLR
jgi:hypothetical protein